MGEHPAVNRSVVSSSLSGAANGKRGFTSLFSWAAPAERNEVRASMAGRSAVRGADMSVRARSKAESFAAKAASPVRGSQRKERFYLSFLLAAPAERNEVRASKAGRSAVRGADMSVRARSKAESFAAKAASPVRGSHDCRRKGCKTKKP